MIIKSYTARYSSEKQREIAKQRFVRNNHPQFIGEYKEGGMSLYQIGSTEVTLMNGENAELGIEIRTPYESEIRELINLMQNKNYLGNKFEEEK